MIRATLLSLVLYSAIANAFYVSYEEPTVFAVGEGVPLIANKLTSIASLSSIDYRHLPLCSSSTPEKVEHGFWSKAVNALHGDALYQDTALDIVAGGDALCTTVCLVKLNKTTALGYEDAIRRGFAYNFMLSGLPVALRQENEESVSTQYWGGIPLGRLGHGNDLDSQFNGTREDSVFLYNHFHIKVFYDLVKGKDGEESFQIHRSVMQPFSIDHSASSVQALSCGTTGERGERFVGYNDLRKMPPQEITSGLVRVTFDIQWIETFKPFRTRWNVYLNMDDAIPAWIEFLSCVLGIVILSFVVGSLYTWVMRDLSYKPIMDESDVFSEAEAVEIQMWPLSTRVFFPPARGSIHLCVLCGMGAHLLSASLIIVVLFRLGIVNATQRANIITPAVILYNICAIVGGYVTARMYAIFHGDQAVAMAASLLTAVAHPLVGMVVVYLTYDVLPEPNAPHLGAITYSAPLLIAWIGMAWPLSLLGGHLGYRDGAIQNFPVSSGNQGYQDLNLQDNSKEVESDTNYWFGLAKRYRITLSILLGGMLPVFASFVSYSYAVAAPVLMGTYPGRSYLIASFLLFVMVSASISALVFYRQIRAHLFRWWWVAFSTSASSGLYIFLLSMSYMIFKSESKIVGSTVALYGLWFGFISLSVALMTGFAGVATCMLFSKYLYTVLMDRQR